MKNVKSEIQKMNLAQLNELSAFINDCKVLNAKATLKVGQKVNVVQKTKKTPGIITKINQSKCLVDMLGRIYRVPMSMLEAA
jgi:FKBP-type peptidyl-prolyl cis-trans isomerase 2|tara:strand:+ start:1148 stop:1393 length:246 start_codon:yes stop_codon:yes gene_type:complete